MYIYVCVCVCEVVHPFHLPPLFLTIYCMYNITSQQLAAKKINAFSNVGHGFYFWNFRTDLYLPQWSYMAALERGWIPKGSLNDPKITNACHNEDLGEFRCTVKHGQQDAVVRKRIMECLDNEGKDSSSVMNLTGTELLDKATKVFNEYWAGHRIDGTTCDFGGVAQLVELNRTITNDDKAYPYYEDDEYFGHDVFVVDDHRSPAFYWSMGVSVFLAIVVGVVLGFVIAMRVNKQFNQSVRENAFFTPLTKSTNPLIRSSLSLHQMSDDYEFIVRHDDDFATANYNKESSNYGSTAN